MIIAPNSRAHKGEKEKGEVKGEYGGISREEEGNSDYEGMVKSSPQHDAPCVKLVTWGFCTRGLGMLVAFWAGIPVDVTQKIGVILRL